MFINNVIKVNSAQTAPKQRPASNSNLNFEITQEGNQNLAFNLHHNFVLNNLIINKKVLGLILYYNYNY